MAVCYDKKLFILIDKKISNVQLKYMAGVVSKRFFIY